MVHALWLVNLSKRLKNGIGFRSYKDEDHESAFAENRALMPMLLVQFGRLFRAQNPESRDTKCFQNI